MLTQYKNIDKIQSSNKAITANRFTDEEISLFKYIVPKIEWGFSGNYRTELHVYSGDTWITGNHKVDIKLPEKLLTSVTDPITNETISLPRAALSIDLYNEFDKLNLTRGNYRVAFNFFRNLIGSYDNQHLRIDEISPDRTEIRLKAIDATDDEFLEQITNYIQTVNQLAEEIIISVTTATESVLVTIPTPKYSTYLLNFGRNKTVMYTNSVVIGEYLYVKLKEPLPADIQQNFKCWVVQEIKSPVIDRVSIQPADVFDSTLTELAGPNWDAISKFDTSTDTGLKTWNDLLGSSVSTSQQIVDSIFSGSLSGIDLNIDYEDFNNFVFYGSATERVKNFHYKISLIEYYESQISLLNSLSGSQNNVVEYSDRKTKLISGFDSFEKFLYYESSSGQFSNIVPLVDPNVSFITGSYITPWPKSNNTRTYTLYPLSSSQVTTWYETLLDNAATYDKFNKNALVYAIPEFIRTQPGNEGLDTFINMLGQHYDILYTYINYMSKIHSRDEHPKYGVPNELLYSVAKQFGWSLTDGNQYKDLWEYVLGTNDSGVPITGSNTVGDASLPGKDMTYHIWRRIVNNLPGLLKSKGTKRSIKALLSCYGIPQSMITIQEYGGPRIERPPVYEKLNFDYALDLIRNAAGTVVTNYSQSIGAVEVRFRTDNVLTNPSMPSTMNLFSVGSNDVTLDFTRGTLGTIQLNGTSSADFECFDGGWITALLRTSGSELELVAKKSKYGKIVATVAASSSIATFPVAGSITLGGSSSASRLQGQLQELRIWTSSLGDSALDNHTKAPSAYDGNVSAYDELVYRLPLTQKIDHSATSSLSGVQPLSSTISSSFASWTNAEPYDSIEETYYFDGISLAAGTFDDNKIRLEDNELVGTLDVKTRAERSQFDKAPLDSKKLGVYFSPQTMINDDIIAQLGFTELDSYIGDPGQQYERSYPDLIRAARDYWKKYDTKNDINAYIKIFSLFDLSFFNQLEQLLPARVDKVTGVLVQPNILERNKDSVLPRPSRTLDSYNTDIDVQQTLIFDPTYDTYLGSVDGAIATITAQDDDQIQGFVTRSAAEKYDGTIYSRDYLYWTGTEYIAGVTPYWMSEALMPDISSSTRSTDRETLSYTEYRKSLYNETAVLTSTSSVADSGSDVVFEGVAHTGSNSTEFTFSTSSIYRIDTWYHDYNAPDSGSNAYLLTHPVTDAFILSSSNVSGFSNVQAPGSGYLFEIQLPASGDSISSETVDIYELINSGSGHPTASGGSTLWGDLYEGLKRWETLQVEEIDAYPGPLWLPLRLLPEGSETQIASVTASLFIGTASLGASLSFSTGSIPVWTGQAAFPGTGTYNSTPIDMLLTGSLTTGSLLEALERSGTYSGGFGVFAQWKFEFAADPLGLGYFDGDTFGLVTLNDSLASPPNGHINFAATASSVYDTIVSTVVTSSAELYPYAEWYLSSGSVFDTRLYDLEYATATDEANALQVNLFASASVLQLSLSSSISASIAATYSSSFNEYTGIQIEWEKWFISSGSDIIEEAPQSANDYIITIDGNAVTTYRTGSASWQRVGYGDDPTLTPGLSASYGLETGADGVIIGDLQAFVDEGDVIEFGIQPVIITNVYETNALVAKARVKNINIFFSYTSSFTYGDIAIGYIVVSGSDIFTTDVNGNPVRGINVNGPAEYQDFIGTGLENSRYNGSKMTSRGFNISSLDTIDGGPVVEFREANPNQLIYQAPGENGSFTISGG